MVSSILRSFYYDRASYDTENRTKSYQRISELLPPVTRKQKHQVTRGVDPHNPARGARVQILTKTLGVHVFASTAAE